MEPTYLHLPTLPTLYLHFLPPLRVENGKNGRDRLELLVSREKSI
jgi:hypothetical protein